MTADDLAEAVTDLGMPYSRAQVTNLEADRRTSVTVGEIIAFGAVLGVPPAFLVMPVGDHEPVEFLPRRLADAWNAWRWFTGDGADTLAVVHPRQHDDVARKFNAYRTHDYAAIELSLLAMTSHEDEYEQRRADQRFADKLETLLARRDALRARKWAVPPVPLDIRRQVESAEKAAGSQSSVGDSLTVVKGAHDHAPAVDTASSSATPTERHPTDGDDQ